MMELTINTSTADRTIGSHNDNMLTITASLLFEELHDCPAGGTDSSRLMD